MKNNFDDNIKSFEIYNDEKINRTKIFDFVLENMADVITVIDHNLNIIFISGSVKNMVGFSEDYFLDKNIINLSLNDDFEKIFKISESKIIDGIIRGSFNYTFFHKDGHKVLSENTYKAYFDSDEALKYILINSREVSKLDKIKVDLRNEKRKLQTILNTNPDLVFHLDKQGNFVGFYQENNENLLIPPEAFVNKNLRDLFDEDFVNISMNAIEYTLIHGSYEYEYELTVGTKKYYHARTGKLNENEVVISVRDITENKNTQIALEESEQKFRNLIENSPDIIYKFSTKNGGLYWSKSLVKILGYLPEEIIEKPSIWQNAIHSDDRDKVLKAIVDDSKGATFNIEYRIKTKDGKWKWIHDSFISKVIKEKEIIIEGHASDITNRKNIEQRLIHNQKILKDLNKTKDRFFSIIAHDLRGPFNGILGFSELLLKAIQEQKFEKLEGYSKFINDSAKHNFDLLNNLLSWSRSQTGQIKFSPKLFNLYDLVESVYFSLNHSIETKGQKFTISVPDDFMIIADKFLLDVVMRNIVSNAVKFTQMGGFIEVFVVAQKQTMQICIKDNGIGIDSANAERLFKIDETFTTKGTSNEAGTGLGLIICDEFVKIHQGEIIVESNVNEGTTFKIVIPVIK
ncbi:MAG: PAS domain S-box protein [Bacteroidales bacterium]|nr:PAS domain S-box protein [Bacteroidales bacterium]